MVEIDVIQRIKELCAARSWTVYRLAKESGITYSTLNTMLHKTNAPSIFTLSKICEGFGITIAQFFSPDDEVSKLTRSQLLGLAHWDKLDEKSKELAAAYMEGLADRQ